MDLLRVVRAILVLAKKEKRPGISAQFAASVKTVKIKRVKKDTPAVLLKRTMRALILNQIMILTITTRQ